MGPSALRIAGIDEKIAGLGFRVTDKGDIEAPDPGDAAAGRSLEEVHPRDRGRLPGALRVGAREPGGGRPSPSCSGATTASRPAASPRRPACARRLGVPLGLIWVDAHGDMNTPAQLDERQRPRHAALGHSRPRAGGTRTALRRLADGSAGAHRPHRHPQPGRAGEGDREGVRRPRLHDEGHRPAGDRGRRRQRAEHRRHRAGAACTSRSTSTSCDPLDRARRRDARQGRPRLPRGAHADGDSSPRAASSRRSTWSR